MDWTLIIVAFIAAVPATIAAWGSYQNGKKIDAKTKEVLTEVKTANNKTLAQLADAVETRRIDAVPEGERTVSDQEHLESMEGKHG